ncbi:MAG: ATP-dependent RNA helicase HrpA [bacterium]|nr:ATP-dependent RNA helicase HrpA [bacterium]
MKQHPVVVVAGETGSGKTTQLPKICLEAGRGLSGTIACTQPRRVAALSVSRRIAEELGVTWGKEVGCKIRFRDQTAPETLVKMMTDGMLLAETQNDPDLLEYDTVIVDEAHERSLNIDFLIGYLRQLRERRPELKLIITSATIDTEAFSEAFGGAPVIEVSGRMYPVEERFRPMEELLEGNDEFTYIDAALQAVEEVMAESARGDVLVFMPSEKDIHETRRRLEGRQFRFTEVLPLFGRLTASEQQKVFSTQKYRRIVVATNVAETSLTIPGIKYVIDTGLARMSRYNPRTQTQRLPIEPISQSSARQRAGRCGRVSGGICVRLYSEQDFESRPKYTQPEIQRANLAEVILRMLALNLGEVETFPFLEPPRPQAIQGGFQLLKELGALDEQNRLTRMGRDMARLPIAPTVSRMVLEAEKEGAVREVLAIAAAISIQDPRVRPLDAQKEADRAHKRFVHQESDFLTLLNIWNAYHDTFEKLQTQARMRRFCKEHFLSFNRMREWRDIYAQLRQTVREIEGFRIHGGDADYDAVHRSVLSGLLSNVAQKKEHNFYRVARGRDVMLFPGSGLFQQKIVEKKGSGKESEKDRTPAWIVAAEVVETSRLFARTVARIQPEWLAVLGAHLCRSSFKEPFWNARSGRVLVTETLTLYGLQVLQRRVPYGRVDPEAATEIFIREALGNDTIRTPHKFLEHNRRVREKVETWQMQMRQYEWLDIDEAVYRFYAERLVNVSSVHDLNRLMKAKWKEDPEFLCMQEEDLAGEREIEHDDEAFPDTLKVDGQELALSYAHKPGQEEDGVTLTVPYRLANFVRPEVLEWLVPGLLEQKIVHLMRSLPKSVRKQFVPIPETAREIAKKLEPTHGTLIESLEAFLLKRYGAEIRRSDWNGEELPPHLKMRVEVVGAEGKPIVAGRELVDLLQEMDHQEVPVSETWKKTAREWEKRDLKGWSCGDLPERVEVENVGGVPVFGYPGLIVREGKVDVCLFREREEAEKGNRAGLMRLYEFELKGELKGLTQDLRALDRLGLLYQPFGSGEDLQTAAYENLVAYLLDRPVYPLTEEAFREGAVQARERVRGLAGKFVETLEGLLTAHQEIRLLKGAYPGMEEDVKRLLPVDFLRTVPFEHLSDLRRYLKAVQMRAERAKLGPAKDREKAQQVEPFQDALEGLLKEEIPKTSDRARKVQEFRWMLEEFRVSVFAQQLGTAFPVSPKRLNQKLEEVRGRV